MHRLYLITNSVNGKRYVGFTSKTLKHRFNEHVYAAMKRNSTCALHCAIRKYGVDAFSIEELDNDLTRLVVGVLETSYIDVLDTHVSNGKGYNQTFGGDGAYGYKHTPEIRLKISLGNKGKTLGRPLSEERKTKLRQSPKNKPVVQLDKRGNELCVFPSARAAARAMGFNDHSQIVRCCTGARNAKIAGGFKWRYKT